MKIATAVLLCFGISALALNAATSQGQVPASAVKPTIISPSHPTDSRHEVVYEAQGKDQKDVPIVDGVLVQPVTLKASSPKFPKSLRGNSLSFDVKVEGVIAPAGDFIDFTVKDAVAPDVEKSIVDAVTRYRFQPATLNGKPVAVVASIVVHFQWCATKAECNTLREQTRMQDKGGVPPTE